MSTPTAAPARPVRPQITLSVVRREQLSPHLVRIVLSGEQFENFVTNDATDKYVKIHFAKPELGLTPPFDAALLRETLAPEDLPVTRTYTVRNVDPDARTLSIDFVVHGTEGLAGPWADAAQPGDLLSFSGPGGGYAPDPGAAWHLFAGDQSALPAIASALAALPATAEGLAFIQVPSASEILDLAAPGAVQIQWLFGTDPGHLSTAVDAATWLPGRPQVFAHGERSAMKGLREVFSARGVQRSELSLSGYWAQGRTEDRFQAEKREPVGQILPVPEPSPTLSR
ncbi:MULTISPECIES: siderophore-interacting protein [unclassified Cryobacterium]|uniref:siderophore-interacting protein n=1 Tax=unclassified Cryobacterium TaxID=2649013 RepID=UPI001069AE0B|nr:MULTISPECIES: siderophore-interacting protein [unclassified Cryobacterium]TFC53678.1 siderophore-interacting protein [Cryobacterium sp. TMB3-1-2]TFC58987.1 siderophore-interacting protein [Cryobacterium sp. TMB1-7]TFC75097.1 siderophore-interacting protein [Cryobacterium sp. TMB3-15]TFC75233.1 siderophore-interacting protein [Cryobacterium sp. TMB3-10]TFD41510.1 siderophore-interacting protein [Cryobacterium sp. TMB3-12]